jgi:hypothetical protein
MTRKLLSEPAEINGRKAHHVVAEIGDSGKIDAYFFNAGQWSYTIGLISPSSGNNDIRDLEAVRNSIYVR